MARARRLRKDTTYTEKLLWTELRKLNRHFRRQAPVGPYVADFISHSARMVVEVDGARHELPDAQLRDAERDAWFASQGYRVLRVRDRDVIADAADVARRVEAAL